MEAITKADKTLGFKGGEGGDRDGRGICFNAQECEALLGNGVLTIRVRRDVHNHHGFPEARDEPLCAGGLPACSRHSRDRTFRTRPREVAASPPTYAPRFYFIEST